MSERVLVIGSGGREHALAWKLAQDGCDVVVAPGSAGIGQDARCVAVSVDDQAGLIALARREAVAVCVIGPEQPLVDGLGDVMREAGIPTVGPSRAAAALEGSKADAKAFMLAHAIPTARHVVVEDYDAGLRALANFATPPVVKADGLAAGKGVVVADDFAAAEAALASCLRDGAFGRAGARVVLEERLHGEEVSLFVLTDGTAATTFLPAQDHKRIGDGDTGPNTGGMGAYAPAPVLDRAIAARVRETIVAPTLAGLRAEGRPFQGVLFFGLMIDARGEPYVIEYNCRFGDPEVQPILFGLEGELWPHLRAAARGELVDGTLGGRAAATIVLAAAGYPGTPRRGDAIGGLEAAAGMDDVRVFHAGTARRGEEWVTAGGRVLGVCARGDGLEAALDRAEVAAGKIGFAGMQRRTDIGGRVRGRYGHGASFAR